MMFKLKYFLPLLLLIVSCDTAVKEMDEHALLLLDENDKLIEEVNYKDSVINEYLRSVNEIEESLAEIKRKENILSLGLRNKEDSRDQKEQIVSDIQLISELMMENKKKISALENQLKTGNIKSAELEKLIKRMTSQLEEKDAEIFGLKAELIKVHNALEHLFSEYNERIEELDQQTARLNTAYYAIGSVKELREKGILTKEGGFIGIGRANKLVNDFDKDYFTKVDITSALSIPLYSKKPRLITVHPVNSYKIIESDQSRIIEITDRDEFWSVSKYLVVAVE